MKRLFGVLLAVCMTFACASAATVNEANVQSVGLEQGENGKVVIQAENAYSYPSGMKMVSDSNADGGEYTSYLNAAKDLEYIFKLNVIDAGEYIFKLKGAIEKSGSTTFNVNVSTSTDNVTYTDQTAMTAASGQDAEGNYVITESNAYKLTLAAGTVYFRLTTTARYTYYFDSLSVTHSKSKTAASFVVGTTGTTRIEAESYDDLNNSYSDTESLEAASGGIYFSKLVSQKTNANNYLDYYIYVEKGGKYSINVSYASNYHDTVPRTMPLDILIDGTAVGALSTTNRLAYDGMATAATPVETTLEQGSRVLRLHNAYTGAVPVSIDYIELTPVKSQLFKSYASGAAVFNTSDGGEYAILAAYNAGKLTAVDVSKLSASAETTLTIDTTGADDVRAFVWKDLSNLTPVESHLNLLGQ